MSKEKQIEEMAKVLEITERKKMDSHCDLPSVEEYATDLYNAGYRKQCEGEWIDKYQGMYANQLYKCSVCGETAFHDDKRWFLTNFCPNCGAKMKGGAE
jgi:DNA-directed RNA polymerase subunit RPC12/RpoP